MRKPLLLGIALVCASACGAKREEARDPSTDTAKPDDGTHDVKWEGAPAKTAEESSTTPPPSRTGSAPREAPTRRSDQYDKEGTEVMLKRAARMVKDNCGAAKDENGKATGPWGKTTVQVMLGHNGHSKGVTVSPPYQGKPVGNCIEKAFTNLQFPPWGGSDTQVDWEVELVQPK